MQKYERSKERKKWKNKTRRRKERYNTEECMYQRAMQWNEVGTVLETMAYVA